MFTGMERSVVTMRPHGSGLLIEFTHRDSELNFSTRVMLSRDNIMSLVAWLDSNFPCRRTRKDDDLADLDLILGEDDEVQDEDACEGPLDGTCEAPEEDRLR